MRQNIILIIIIIIILKITINSINGYVNNLGSIVTQNNNKIEVFLKDGRDTKNATSNQATNQPKK